MASISAEEIAVLSDMTTDSRRALVKRILGSSIFIKSERLSSFLVCVCDMTLSGRAHEINEQKIGTMVFGRSVGYDPSVDGIVRTQASRLRQRLDLYFTGDGADEPIRIVLPKGSYVPSFERQLPPPSITTAQPSPDYAPRGVLPEISAALEPRAFRGAKLAWGLVAVLAMALFATLYRDREASVRAASAPAVANPLWSSIFSPTQRTMIVPGDSGLVLWGGVTKQKIGLADYLSGSYRTRASSPSAAASLNAIDLANRRYTSIVDLEMTRTLSRIADSRKSHLELRYARDVRPNDLKDGNVVLIGAATANPWVELFEPNMNFVFSYDPLNRVDSVLNRSPTGTEPRRWDSQFIDAQHHVYGVVAYLPSLSRKGNVLILEGTSMAGTECAWDFVAEDATLMPFLDRIKSVDGEIPHFQVVLQTNNMSGNSVKSNIVAWRVMN